MADIIPVIRLDPGMSPQLRAEAEQLEALALRTLGVGSTAQQRAAVVNSEMSTDLRRHLRDRLLVEGPKVNDIVFSPHPGEALPVDGGTPPLGNLEELRAHRLEIEEQMRLVKEREAERQQRREQADRGQQDPEGAPGGGA